MTASTSFKGLLAGVAALALIGTAIAQGNPPNPAVKNAPTGAGQQSSQNTPMGTTGTPGATATGSTATGSTGGGTTMGTASSGATSPGASMGSGSTSADTSATTRTTRPMRTAKADRN